MSIETKSIIENFMEINISFIKNSIVQKIKFELIDFDDYRKIYEFLFFNNRYLKN